MSTSRSTFRYTYNEFRSYIKGRGYSSTDRSNLWAAYKLKKISNKDLDDPRILKNYLTPIDTTRKRSPRKITRKPSPRKITHKPKPLKLASKSLERSKIADDQRSLEVLTNIMPYLGTKYAPKEILWNIMLKMDIENILNLCQTDKYFFKTVCDDKFWKYYVNKKYGEIELGIYQSWRDWVINYTHRYGVVAYQYRKINNKNTAIVEDLVVDSRINNNKIKKILTDELGNPYYIISDKLEVYYINIYGGSRGAHQIFDIDNIIDGYIYKRDLTFHELIRIYNDITFLIKSNGVVYYSLVDRREPRTEDPFIILPGIKADKIYDGYILNKDRSITRYQLTDIGELVLSKYETPVPFKFISDYHSTTNIFGRNQNHIWTIALDYNGRIWVKGDNFAYQIGEKTKQIPKFTKLDVATKIKKVLSYNKRTVFFGEDNSVWLLGSFPKNIIKLPQKVNLVYSKTVKGKKVDYPISIIDIAFARYGLHFIDDTNTLYRIDNLDKIVRAGANIPKEYKNYYLKFIAPVFIGRLNIFYTQKR